MVVVTFTRVKSDDPAQLAEGADLEAVLEVEMAPDHFRRFATRLPTIEREMNSY